MKILNPLNLLAERLENEIALLWSFNKAAGRGLTGGEKTLAKSVFGDQIDYDRVRLSRMFFVSRTDGLTCNERIYLPQNFFGADLSTQSLEKQRLLIHELTHIWQKQQRKTSFFSGQIDFFRALVTDIYKYDTASAKPFKHLGAEQQASLVEDYFFHREKGRQDPESRALALCLAKKIGDVLPLQP